MYKTSLELLNLFQLYMKGSLGLNSQH